MIKPLALTVSTCKVVVTRKRQAKENEMTTFTRTSIKANGAQVGTIVSYEDMSNPARFFTVIGEVKDAWGTEAQLVDLSTGRIQTSSLRGAGWVLAEVAA